MFLLLIVNAYVKRKRKIRLPEADPNIPFGGGRGGGGHEMRLNAKGTVGSLYIIK